MTVPSVVMSDSLVERFWRKVAKGDDCWEWTGSRNGEGYGHFRVTRKDVAKAHRVAYELTHGPIPVGMIVQHTCDNPPCVRPDHLVVGTKLTNRQDAVAKRRQAVGEHNGRSRLTAAAVLDIRARFASGDATLIQLAAEYGVAMHTVWMVTSRRNWRHI